MRASSKWVLTLAVGLGVTGCVPKPHTKPDWMKPPKSYDPVATEGLSLNKAGVDALTLKEGAEREAFVKSLQAKGAFTGQAKCKGGGGTGDLPHSQWGEYELNCVAGTILFDIELNYRLFTTREAGKPLSANAYVDFSGTLVEFRYHDDSNPRTITAMVQLDELSRISD